MKKLAIYTSLAFGVLLLAGTVLAHDGTAAVTAADLGVSEPTLLPTSTFYFVKEWGRGIQLFFTFNAVSKADLQLRFADEKLLEAKAVADAKPGDTQALARALANYKDAADRLSARLQGLKGTSQNPNVDKLLNKLAERVVKHEKLFADLKESAPKTSEKDVNAVEDTLGQGLLEKGSGLDNADKLVERIKKAAEAEKVTSDFEKIQRVELFDRLESKAQNEDVKDLLRKAREDSSDDVKDVIENELKSTTTEAVIEQLKAVPGDEALKVQIISEIKLRAGKSKPEFDDIEKGLTEKAANAEDLPEKALEQIKAADEKISELADKLSANPDKAAEPAKVQLDQAKEKLIQAKKAFDDKNYGQAFGQAQAAEVLTRNGLRMIKKTGEINKSDKECGPMPLMPVPAGCKGPVCKEGKWKFICPEKEEQGSGSSVETPARTACTQEWNPVCGANGKTYSNECTAKTAGVAVKYKGECGATTNADCGPMPELAAPPTGCKYDGPYCKEGQWKYALVCPETNSSITPSTTTVAPTTTAVIASQAFKVEADDSGFYPSGTITVAKGAKVSLTFAVRTSNVYFGGLDFRSAKFKTETVKPGTSATVEFTADESFDFTSYWPLTNTSKATGKVVVQ